MTHPFALSIDDLQTLELLDGESDHTGEMMGGSIRLQDIPEAHYTKRVGEGGGHPGVTFKTHEGGFTFKVHENGGLPPSVITNAYPENGGPIPVSQLHVEHGGPYLN
jgi:hypothetical protein